MDTHKLLPTQVLSLTSWMIEWSNKWNMKLKVALNNRMSVWVLPGVKSVQNDPLEGYIYASHVDRAVGEKLPEKYTTPVNPTALSPNLSAARTCSPRHHLYRPPQTLLRPSKGCYRAPLLPPPRGPRRQRASSPDSGRAPPPLPLIHGKGWHCDGCFLCRGLCNTLI